MASDRKALLGLARGEFAKGRAARSRELCVELLASSPGEPEALHLLAILDLSAGNAAHALAPIERALAGDALDARKHQTHGLILRALARGREAFAAFREALRLSPEFPEAHASLALGLMEEGAYAEAASHLERALGARPGVYVWNLHLGLCRARLDDAPGAVDAFTRAARLNDAMPEAHNNLGTALLSLGRFEEAERSFRRSIALAPAHSHAWTNLGNVLRRTGRAGEAEDAYRRATQGEPRLAIAWVNLGNCLEEADRIDEALKCFDHATAIEPGLAEAHLSRAIACLLAGDNDRGFDEYRWRLTAPPDDGARDRVRAATRDANPVEIQGEQGLGDVLFFLRWAPALRAAGARLAFRGDPRLFPLLERGGVFERFVEESAAGAAALRLPAGDLPWIARGMVVPFPSALALQASPEALEAARSLLEGAGPPPYVGVAWRAGLASTGSTEHLHKMVPPEALGAALRHVAGTIVSLQREAQGGEIDAIARAAGRPVLDAGGVNSDLDAMLGLLDVLHDYAGVSSTNVHLRAGLGRGARILVPVPPEWRSGRSGPHTPWFPAFTLYRQDRERGWSGPLDALSTGLVAAHGKR